MDWSLLWGVGPSGILGICWNLLEFVGICWNLSQCRVRSLNTFSWSYCIASTSTRNSNHHLVSSRLSGEREIMWIGFCFATSKCLIHRFSSGSNSVLLVSSSSIHRLCCFAGVQFSAKERIGRHECDAPFYLWSGWRTLWVGRFASLSATCRPLRIWALLPCYCPCLSRVALVSFARFYYTIDLAFRMPCGGLWGGCHCCFARSLILVSAGRYRQNGRVRSPSWLRSFLVDRSSAVVTSGCTCL